MSCFSNGRKKIEGFTPITGYGLIRTIIQEQNLILLNKIADTMSLSELKEKN